MCVPRPIKFHTFRCWHVSIHGVRDSEEPGSWLIWLLLKLAYVRKKIKAFEEQVLISNTSSMSLLDCLFLGSHTNKFSEGELHFCLFRSATAHELCFYFYIFELQMENFLLQGLLEPRAPLLIWAQVRNGETDCKAQDWGTDSQRYMTVGRSVAIIKENLCKGLMLWNELKYIIRNHNTLIYLWTCTCVRVYINLM